ARRPLCSWKGEGTNPRSALLPASIQSLKMGIMFAASSRTINCKSWYICLHRETSNSDRAATRSSSNFVFFQRPSLKEELEEKNVVNRTSAVGRPPMVDAKNGTFMAMLIK